ncbi:MAG: chordopoxvirus fusion protein, partial [bacterium]|nr:chordopoxvirus fusion protein [bacterium]
VRMGELAEAQKHTEARLDELAKAQRRTEEALCELTEEHRKTREQLGGLSATVGYGLEDKAYIALPGLLQKDFGISVTGKINRKHVEDRVGGFIEVNIIGEATRNGKKIMIVGESKSQLSQKAVDTFIRKKLKRLEGVYEEMLPVLVTYMTTAHDVEEYAKKKGIALYYSYDFPQGGILSTVINSDFE